MGELTVGVNFHAKWCSVQRVQVRRAVSSRSLQLGPARGKEGADLYLCHQKQTNNTSITSKTAELKEEGELLLDVVGVVVGELDGERLLNVVVVVLGGRDGDTAE